MSLEQREDIVADEPTLAACKKAAFEIHKPSMLHAARAVDCLLTFEA
jgi:hypothetical protein